MSKGEPDYPETVFVRDIETRVFQVIVLQCLASIEGISLPEGGIIDNFLGRGGADRIKGVVVDQDAKNHSVKVRIDVNISFGLSIPEKSDEIQSRVSEQVTKLTGVHVASVHVVFKSVMSPPEPDVVPEAVLLESSEGTE